MAEAKAASSRDVPGTMREYETTYILRPDISEDGIAEVNNRIRGVIGTGGGILLEVKNWGRRRLAYEVKKHLRGTYLFWRYLGQAGLVEEVERHLRMLDAVIRHYTVKTAENVEPASRTTEVTDESFAQASVPGPDEEAIATGQASRRSDDEDEFDGVGLGLNQLDEE